MNSSQSLWWEQAKSDLKVFHTLCDAAEAECHSLHYLQMASEKIAKAYFWREADPPPKKHAGFHQFVRLLASIPMNDRSRVAGLFKFQHFDDFKAWTRGLIPIAYELEHVHPQLAPDGPNCEYPWPHVKPRWAPALYSFPIWAKLKTHKGRNLLRLIEVSIERFPEYADA